MQSSKTKVWRRREICTSYPVQINRFHNFHSCFTNLFFQFWNCNKLLAICFICDFIFFVFWKYVNVVILRLANRISYSQIPISRLRRFSVSQFHSDPSQKNLRSTLQWWFQPCKPIIHIKSVTITAQNHLTNRFCHFQTTEFKINTYGKCSS